MPTSRACVLVLAGIIGCGSDHNQSPPDSINNPAPRVIAGGGIGDGPINGVANLYVIDDATRTPIAGATVQIGTLTGATDATGLYTATGVVGPQTVFAAAPGYRAEMWIGANGANVTIDLVAAVDPAPASANLSGAIAGFDALVLAAGHRKTASVAFSQTDDLGNAANGLKTAGNANLCDVPALAGQACNFTVTSRTGHVALVAVILDHDPIANTFTPIGWAYRTGITVASGVNQTGQDLAMVSAPHLTNVTVDFGTPPSGLANVAALVGIELGTSEGIMQLPIPLTPTNARLLVPALTEIAGSTYRLTAFANASATGTAASSATLVRGNTTTALAAGTWLAVPASPTITHTTASWSPVAGALVQGAEWSLPDGTRVFSATAFDASTSVTVPAAAAVPASGVLATTATAIAATLDPTNFTLDRDKSKITGASSLPIAIN